LSRNAISGDEGSDSGYENLDSSTELSLEIEIHKDNSSSEDDEENGSVLSASTDSTDTR
jgi:hypothetical protein